MMTTENDWYVYRDQQRWGPYSWEQMLEMAQFGNINLNDKLWHPQYPNFINANQVQGLFDFKSNELAVSSVAQRSKTSIYCPSCGKEALEGSRFCLNCGNPLSANVVKPASALQWEYKYVTFPENRTFLDVPRGQKPPFIGLGDKTVSSALNEIWITLERNVHESIEDEIAQGWEPDPNGWGASCIEYRVRKVGTDYWGCGQWVGYLIFGIVSYGILLLVLPFTWKFDILEPITIKVRLRKVKR